MNVMNFVSVTGTELGGDTITGTDADEFIDARGNNSGANGDVGDVIHAGGGNDTIRGSISGDDLFDGGDRHRRPRHGRLVLQMRRQPRRRRERRAGAPSRPSNYLNFENAITCNASKSTLTGDDGPNLLQGWADEVVINGMGGDDQLVGSSNRQALNGGDGDDILEGSNEPDVLHGDAGDDILRGGPHD